MQILHNAKIYTFSKEPPVAASLAIDDHAPHAGRILAVGDDQTIENEFGERAEKEDMQGAVILPGLIDAHLHLRHYALGLQKVDLFNLTLEECLDKIEERVQETPPNQWVLGHGWNQNNWGGEFPKASDLEAVSQNNPVYLTATSLHSAWVNNAALSAAGVAKHTPDPVNGKIQRFEGGDPTGILFEKAMDLVSKTVPSPTTEENIEAIQIAQEKLWQVGLTSVHDFDRIKSFEALQILHRNADLKLRVLKHLPVKNLVHILESGLRSGFGDDMLRIGSIKVFADGALGPLTAAMLQPYQGGGDNKGMLFLDSEELFEQARAAALGGLSMTVHAIGDRANHEVLNAYRQLRKFEKDNGLPHLRHRLEHAQILHPDDIQRFKQLDIIASVQPIHQSADMLMADRYWGERSQYSYAWQSLLKQGARLAFGSDAPVETPNPFYGVHAAVTRQRRDGSPGADGWHSEQRLDVAAAFHGYTRGAAYAAGMEDKLGQLSAGFLADLIVLPEDPFEIPANEIHQIKPKATMLGGDWVWRK